MKKGKWIGIGFFGIILILGFTLYFKMQRALPSYGESLTYPELQGVVEIHTDSYGIPHIFADSKEDLYLKRNKIKEKYAGKTVTIWAEKISLNKNFVTKLDLFDIGVFDSDYYVSEILKNAIEKQKITGTLLEPTNKIHVGKIK
jgi:hypothetical protein